MKNIFLIPTDRPSRVHLIEDVLTFTNEYKNSVCDSEVNIYITSDEEIKEGDWYINTFVSEREQKPQTHTEKRHLINHQKDYRFKYCKKIILTTDQDLIKDGVQAIDDEFLEWFVKNPSCEVIKTQLKLPWESSKDEYEIIIPKEEPEQETIGEAALKYSAEPQYFGKMSGFRAGVKWQMERSYNEEDMKKAFEFYAERTICDVKYLDDDFNEFIKQFKK